MKTLLCTVIGILLLITLVSCTDSSSTETTSESHTESTETTLLSDENETSENDPEESKSEESVPETTPAYSETESESLPESSETVTESTTTPQESVSEPVSAEPQPTLYAPRVMMYHLISNNLNGTNNSLYVRPTEFEEHLILLNELGFEYIFADEWRYTENPSVALTFDDGYVDNYTVMFPLLKQYNAKATIFVITNLIGTDGYLTADMIREMSDSGFVSIQCHTVNHYNLNQIDVNTMRNEFKISSDVIKSLTGKDVKALAYPMGMFNSTVISVAGEYFDFAYTTDSPFYVWEYTTYNIPRYFVRRNDGRYRFYNYLK